MEESPTTLCFDRMYSWEKSLYNVQWTCTICNLLDGKRVI